MTDPTTNGEEPTDAPSDELASLKREFDDLRETVRKLRAERQQTTDQLYQTLRGLGLSGAAIEANVTALTKHGMTRRAAMLATIGAIGGAGFMTGRVSAAASTSDSDGDVGTPANPVDVFADGIAKDGTAISVGDSLVPDTASSLNLGSNSNPWAGLYTDAVNGGGPVSDGDGTERQVWIIANGAADPAGAGTNDIIFEEQ